MKVSAIRIFVRDLGRAKTFYTDILGLNLINHAQEEGVILLNDGRIDIVVEQVLDSANKEDQALVGRFTGFSFLVDDIACSVQHLKEAGVQFTALPERQYWGGYLATFADTDGNELQLVQAPGE